MNKDSVIAVLFGIVALLVGVGIGYLMYTHPEGLNPEWNIWIAMAIPAMFALAGLHMIASGLNLHRLSMAALKLIPLGLLMIANWAAFFTTGYQCSQTLPFLGVEILQRYPSEAACQFQLRTIMGGIDTMIVLAFIAFAFYKLRESQRKKIDDDRPADAGKKKKGREAGYGDDGKRSIHIR